MTAEVDFSQTESTSEQFRPNQTPDATAIRSQQVMESSSGNASTTANGCSRRRSQPAPRPLGCAHQRRQPGSHGRVASSRRTNRGSRKRESITNYEVDKTVKVTRGGARHRQAPERSRGGELPKQPGRRGQNRDQGAARRAARAA
ncbi:MAG: flagellar M-ring protein FliF C-terminal domain-containing protein [Giesbergeria sp.]